MVWALIPERFYRSFMVNAFMSTYLQPKMKKVQPSSPALLHCVEKGEEGLNFLTKNQ